MMIHRRDAEDAESEFFPCRWKARVLIPRVEGVKLGWGYKPDVVV